MNEIQTLDFVTDDSDRMTSLQIAEITGRAHSDVMKSIRKMEPAWSEINEGNFSLVEYIDKKGESRPCYSLTKEECLYIATKFNDVARAKLIKRWKELEERKKPAVPTTYLDALKSLVKSEEEKQQLALENKQQHDTIVSMTHENVALGNKITEMLPKVSYYDQILQSKSTMTVTQIAQDYGMSAMKLNKLLADMRIQRKIQGQWVLYSQFLGGGYVHSKSVTILLSDGTQKVKLNTEWTTKGQIFIYQALKAKGIVPMIERKEKEVKQQPIDFKQED